MRTGEKQRGGEKRRNIYLKQNFPVFTPAQRTWFYEPAEEGTVHFPPLRSSTSCLYPATHCSFNEPGASCHWFQGVDGAGARAGAGAVAEPFTMGKRHFRLLLLLHCHRSGSSSFAAAIQTVSSDVFFRFRSAVNSGKTKTAV